MTVEEIVERYNINPSYGFDMMKLPQDIVDELYRLADDSTLFDEYYMSGEEFGPKQVRFLKKHLGPYLKMRNSPLWKALE